MKNMATFAAALLLRWDLKWREMKGQYAKKRMRFFGGKPIPKGF